MKIDYPNIENPGGVPFVRLYEFQREEAQKLKQVFEALAAGTLKQVELRQITTVESVDGTELTFTRGEKDKGVVHTEPQRFDFSMSSEGWLRAAALTEAICQQTYMHGYQWLAECTQAKIELLLSTDGDW